MDEPLDPDDRFSVELRRFIEQRPDPSRNRPPAGGEIDPLALLAHELALELVV